MVSILSILNRSVYRVCSIPFSLLCCRGVLRVWGKNTCLLSSKSLCQEMLHPRSHTQEVFICIILWCRSWDNGLQNWCYNEIKLLGILGNMSVFCKWQEVICYSQRMGCGNITSKDGPSLPSTFHTSLQCDFAPPTITRWTCLATPQISAGFVTIRYDQVLLRDFRMSWDIQSQLSCGWLLQPQKWHSAKPVEELPS